MNRRSGSFFTRTLLSRYAFGSKVPTSTERSTLASDTTLDFFPDLVFFGLVSFSCTNSATAIISSPLLEDPSSSMDTTRLTAWPQKPALLCPSAEHVGKQRMFFCPPRRLFRRYDGLNSFMKRLVIVVMFIFFCFRCFFFSFFLSSSQS